MKLHIVTIGEPKLAYAREGFLLYIDRLRHYHHIRVTHISDKKAYDAATLHTAAGNAFVVALDNRGKEYTSEQLAKFLERAALTSRELCLVIGGPRGLPAEIVSKADMLLSMSAFTFPHDLAMVILAEALYRASTINAGQKYHK